MIVRSKAPFRLGLAGGGTDVSPYSDTYGGAVLNATVNLYAYTTIIPRTDDKIIIRANNASCTLSFDAEMELPIDGQLDLQKGVYNHIVSAFAKKPLPCEIITDMDVPSGSGLGTSSTLVVSILGAFIEWLNIPLSDYDIAQLAYTIERKDLNMAGGKQDQYAATFGGINFMEFLAEDKVIVKPLRIKSKWINELQFNLILYYTQTSRESSSIIRTQAENVIKKASRPIKAMHELKNQAFLMKSALLSGDLTNVGQLLDSSWHFKKEMAEGISNSAIDNIYTHVKNAGAIGGKMSGAGGGGFMFFYAGSHSKQNVLNALAALDGDIRRFEFSPNGLTTWKFNG